jgi:hypothetical protein
MKFWALFAALFLMLSSTVFAMGDTAYVFEKGNVGGIWDHGDTVYLVFKTQNHPDLWAGLNREDEKSFSGEVVSDQFGKNEKRTNATARVIEEVEGRKTLELTFKFENDREPVNVIIKTVKN